MDIGGQIGNQDKGVAKQPRPGGNTIRRFTADRLAADIDRLPMQSRAAQERGHEHLFRPPLRRISLLTRLLPPSRIATGQVSQAVGHASYLFNSLLAAS